MCEVRKIRTQQRQENAETSPVAFIGGRLKTNYILPEACGSTCKRSKLG